MRHILTAMLGGLMLAGWVGCGGDARVELAAADAISATADQFDVAFGEYHDEVRKADDAREDEVLAAFVMRVQADADNAAEHIAAFKAAMAGIREDREVETRRLAAARDNVGVLREISQGLTRIGVAHLTLSEEARRYLTSWVEARQRAAEVGK